MKQKVIYYKDEWNDDFAGTDIQRKPLRPDFEYVFSNRLRKGWAFFVYHFIAFPIVFILQKVIYREKIVGREKLRKYKKTGCFLYGNHTRAMGDAYSPAIIAAPYKAYVTAGPDAFSIPFVGRIVEDLGGLPVPDGMTGMRNYYRGIIEHVEKGHVIAFYPEAHIWPYYTGIRPFPDSSFLFPAKTGKPVFTYTTTYRKTGIFKLTQTVVYIDGPFFPEEGLSATENKKRLRDLCYDAMVERSRNSTYEKIKYVKIDEDRV